MIISSILFVIILSLILGLPAQVAYKSSTEFVAAVVIIEIVYIIAYLKTKKKSMSDVVSVIYILLIIWEVVTKLQIAHPVLVPAPENVFAVFNTNAKDMLEGACSSMILLVQGILYAMVLGIFGGLFVGYVPRLRDTFLPITRVISSIPPLVYTPYVVAVMPSFKSASVFIIFSAVFWPNFTSMIARVGSIDKKIIDSAKAMDLSLFSMLFKIILPYSLPDVIGRLSGSVTSAMLCLTGAEMLGANSGLGYFVKKYSDYADYKRVIAGIILIAVVVTIINILIKALQKKVIKWKY